LVKQSYNRRGKTLYEPFLFDKTVVQHCTTVLPFLSRSYSGE
jgi:hypothetical protein